MSRFLFYLFTLTTVLIALSSAAFAHARPTHAEPTPGRTVKPLPTQVVMDFTEDLEPRFSSIIVQNAQGQRFDNGTCTRHPAIPSASSSV